MELLAGLVGTVFSVPFLVILVATFVFVWVIRKYVLYTFWPKFAQNRWFKSILPFVVWGIAIGFSFIPLGPAVVWGEALFRGIIAGGLVVLLYSTVRNFIRERKKAIIAKVAEKFKLPENKDKE